MLLHLAPAQQPHRRRAWLSPGWPRPRPPRSRRRLVRAGAARRPAVTAGEQVRAAGRAPPNRTREQALGIPLGPPAYHRLLGQFARLRFSSTFAKSFGARRGLLQEEEVLQHMLRWNGDGLRGGHHRGRRRLVIERDRAAEELPCWWEPTVGRDRLVRLSERCSGLARRQPVRSVLLAPCGSSTRGSTPAQPAGHTSRRMTTSFRNPSRGGTEGLFC